MERKASLLVSVILSFCAAAAVAEVQLLNIECGGGDTLALDVLFESQVECGELISTSLTAQRPTVRFKSANEGDHYTLMMVDPSDALSPDTHVYRYWLHWLVTDIKGSELLEFSNLVKPGKSDVTGYVPPRPPYGTHRYYFYLYKQSRSPLSVSPITERARFDPGAFASLNNLGNPVAMNMFKAKKN